MSAPPILATRRKTVAHLKGDAAVTAQLPAAQIFGERSDPATPYPFVRCSEFEGLPGHIVRGNVHVFSKATFSDECAELVELLGSSIDSAVLVLDDGRRGHAALVGTQILSDPIEQSAWHGVVAISVTIARDCAE